MLLVDDDALIRAGVRAVLGAEPDLEVVGEAADGAEVVPLARRLRPDVVLMDVRMPAVDGIRATELLLRGDDAPRVLVLTTFENDEYVYDALRAGASGFLLKRVPPQEIVDAVRLVARGESLLFPASIRRLAEQYAPAAAAAPGAAGPHLPRGGGARARRGRPDERRDRDRARAGCRDRQDARRQPARQAGRAGPHAGGHRRVRVGVREPRRSRSGAG